MKINFSEWQLKALDSSVISDTITAEVPGCVHTDLLRHNLIPDPYLDQNEMDLQWISETDWEYSTEFELSPEAFCFEHLDLNCEGLDTIAILYINNVEIAQTINMHRAYRFEVKHLVKEGTNSLKIIFKSPTKWAATMQEKMGDLPNAYKGVPFNFIRKMACNYGWDWGPILTTSGIWQEIYLDAWNVAKIAPNSVRPLITLDDDLKQAHFDIQLELLGNTNEVELKVTLMHPYGKHNVVHIGTETNFSISSPVLWWPVGHGLQPRYYLQIELKQGEQHLDGWSQHIGIRKVELDTSLDDVGSAFTFKINNKAIFIKGANWIPDDCFPTRVTRNDYENRINQAIESNMNMLRIWGGGIYENSEFYDICDSKGMLVWQDFLFACAAYPEEEPFYSEVKAEAEYQVSRLSKHTSLVLWNGNNENLWGYISWDWQRDLENRTWGEGYYLELLPEVVNRLDPTLPYYVGSPFSGTLDIHPLADNHGCKHVWDAWNETDYSIYRAYVPRFVAEFGHQAPPNFSTLERSISERPLKPDSPTMLHHQKAINGNDKLHARLTEHFALPEDIHLWHYATQLNQARAIDYGVSHWRSSAPVCMGTLYWQLNDCWPVTSWAAVDGYGQKKLLWYATRKFYADRLATIQPQRDKLALFIINDSDVQWDEEVTVKRYSFSGEVLASYSIEVAVEARASEAYLLDSDFNPSDKSTEFLKASCKNVADALSFYFFDMDKRLNYPKADYAIEVQENQEGYSVQVTAKSFLRDLVFYADKLDASSEVNEQLVTLLPNESFVFEVYTEAKTVTVEAIGEARALLCANDLTSY